MEHVGAHLDLPGSGDREGRGAMKTGSGGRSDGIDPGDAPRSVRQRLSRLKMPRRNAVFPAPNAPAHSEVPTVAAEGDASQVCPGGREDARGAVCYTSDSRADPSRKKPEILL